MIELESNNCNCKITSTVIELVFGKFLKNRNNNSREEEKLFIVLGYEVDLKHMNWLFLILVQASLLAFAQFWDDFLLEVTYTCSTDSILHCFYTTDLPLPFQELNCSNTSQVPPLPFQEINCSNSSQVSPLPFQQLNCSNTSQVEEATTIVCYQYVFSTGRAAASVIGIISATGLIIYTVCVVFLKFLDGARLSICSILVVKLVAIFEVLSSCAVLCALQVIYTCCAATALFGITNSFFKTLAMGAMIANSVYFLPMDKFRKLQNGNGAEPLVEDQYQQLHDRP